MRVLLTGAGGQLGRELQRCVPSEVELVASSSSELDVTREDDVAAAVSESAPELVLNAAAFTAVDRAEAEPEAAFAVNEEGVAHLAAAARRARARLVHLSTDFVFDGQAAEPYQPRDEPRPLSVYGRSKLAGERRALELLGERCAVVRTAWLYSRFGRNFVTNMLRLMRRRDELAVVDDQRGSPTWAAGLAVVLWRLAARPELSGVWHWTDAGVCTWYRFAVAVREEGMERGLLATAAALRPVTSAEFGARAPRPAYSALDGAATREALGIEATPWRTALGRMLDEMVAESDDG